MSHGLMVVGWRISVKTNIVLLIVAEKIFIQDTYSQNILKKIQITASKIKSNK